MFSPDEMSGHPLYGRDGPSWKGELLKQSAHMGKWSDRYFVLKERKLWYYESESDARPRKGKPNGEPKGYYDCVAAKISEFEEQDEDEIFFGFEIEEEYGLWTGGIEAAGDKIRLCHSVIDARDQLVEKLKYASRPTWIADDDVRATTCMESKEAFTFFDRKHHCRKCGGAFLAKCMVKQPLPTIGYDEPVWCCAPCASGKKKASRWIKKLPMKNRGTKEKAAGDQIADEVAETAAKVFKSVSSFFGD